MVFGRLDVGLWKWKKETVRIKSPSEFLGACCRKVKFLPPKTRLDRFQKESEPVGSEGLVSGGCLSSAMTE
jgi:hypothetical protein